LLNTVKPRNTAAPVSSQLVSRAKSSGTVFAMLQRYAAAPRDPGI
jgi:hypothetical protein